MSNTYTAKSLVPILGERFGVPQASALMIDRALGEGKLRRKGIGRNWPAMSRGEGIIFLLACMVSQKLTRAAEDVRPWVSAKSEISVPQVPDANDLENRTTEEAYQQQIRLVASALEHLPKRALKETHVFLVDWLLAVCALLEDGDIEADETLLELSLSQGIATVEFHTKSGDPICQTFDVGRPDDGKRRSPSAIETISAVSGAALLEVVSRTERAPLRRDSVIHGGDYGGT